MKSLVYNQTNLNKVTKSIKVHQEYHGDWESFNTLGLLMIGVI